MKVFFIDNIQYFHCMINIIDVVVMNTYFCRLQSKHMIVGKLRMVWGCFGCFVSPH